MLARETLTTEHLKKNFNNNFELAAYAIRLGKEMIKTGRETNLDILLREVETTSQKPL